MFVLFTVLAGEGEEEERRRRRSSPQRLGCEKTVRPNISKYQNLIRTLYGPYKDLIRSCPYEVLVRTL